MSFFLNKKYVIHICTYVRPLCVTYLCLVKIQLFGDINKFGHIPNDVKTSLNLNPCPVSYFEVHSFPSDIHYFLLNIYVFGLIDIERPIFNRWVKHLQMWQDILSFSTKIFKLSSQTLSLFCHSCFIFTNLVNYKLIWQDFLLTFASCFHQISDHSFLISMSVIHAAG